MSSTTPAPATTDPVQDEHADPSCSVCPHTWSEHDALGRRFCTATRDVGWSRGCICPAGTA
ncbi:MAG TPA: RGCVC family protein [Actinomycetospora sp.]|nr:RGCVC family protein [Actinomycetospora sp.]